MSIKGNKKESTKSVLQEMMDSINKDLKKKTDSKETPDVVKQLFGEFNKDHNIGKKAPEDLKSLFKALQEASEDEDVAVVVSRLSEDGEFNPSSLEELIKTVSDSKGKKKKKGSKFTRVDTEDFVNHCWREFGNYVEERIKETDGNLALCIEFFAHLIQFACRSQEYNLEALHECADDYPQAVQDEIKRGCNNSLNDIEKLVAALREDVNNMFT